MEDFIDWLDEHLGEEGYALQDLRAAYKAGKESERASIVAYIRGEIPQIAWDDHEVDVREKLAKLIEMRGES